MKKSIILITILIMTSTIAYSNSLGLGLYIPLGGSIPSLYQNDNANPNITLSPHSAFEIGVIFQPRVSFQADKKGIHHISIGLDVGWYRDTFKFQYDYQDFTHEFDSLMTGINFEWRPLIFQVGIGGGVKFPFTGKYWIGDNDTALNGGNVSARFKNPLIPYIRLYTGINLLVLSLSLYANFDISNMQIKDNLSSLGEGYKYPGKLFSIDIGVQFGIHLDIFQFGKNEREELIFI
ncbi:hypothetical protein Q5M87_09465 [Brachyspira innocens]|uniref:hypothetical protein n=1 Tax=Brachyspira innocens TaxID=13264 RepID=UPI0026F366D0|nr:hypothetical protein [Brachyspira innocens]MDO6994235.1 hypothetical protein [Brachyspira innocens]